MTDDRLLAAKKKFSRLLKEIFQFDCADLDFGIYRILAMRRAELERFLDDELLPQVEGILAAAAGDRASVQSELSKLESSLRDAGIHDFSSSPKWNELKGELDASPDVAVLAREVFSDLTTFFARYYDEGDFMALPRYKGDTYAIPYDGSEVKLHWANADQYYVKTTEQHADYTAVIDGASGLDAPRIRFRLAHAESDRDNNKSTENRRYVLRGESPIEVEDNQITIWFEYRVPEPGGGRQRTQKAICEETEVAVLRAVPPIWQAALTRTAAQNPDKYTVLGYQLYRYTKKNTSDYFIHKDLGGFLRREIDLFIKNEILFLDDIEGRKATEIEVALQKVKAVRAVGGKIIDWLAQIEDFQKRLFRKKKFVLRTELVASQVRCLHESVPAHIREMAKARAIQIMQLSEPPDATQLSIETPSDSEDFGFYHFDSIGTRTALTHVRDWGSEFVGLLVRGENLGAMNLLKATYAESVDLAYLDPPYNTGEDGFAYKDAYQHASWLSMFCDRIRCASMFLPPNGVVFVSLDDNELPRGMLAWSAAGIPGGCLATFIWEKRTTRENRRAISINHDYVLAFSRAPSDVRFSRLPLTAEVEARYQNPDRDPRGPWQSVSANAQAGHATAGQFYAVHLPSGRIVEPPPGRCWVYPEARMLDEISKNNIWFGKSGNGVPRIKRFPGPDDGLVPETLWPAAEVGTTDESKKQLLSMFHNHDGALALTTPKSEGLIRRILQITPSSQRISAIDPFAGTGTTGHAIIALNREDGGDRQFILVESGDHFDTVLVPRILKAALSSTWRDGQPVTLDPLQGLYKIQTLEAYDDSLENIELVRPDSGELFGRSALREDYTLRYMLNFEAEGSLLNLERFRKPWDYTIKVRRDGIVQDSPVDLVETFNYLIGLRVTRYDTYDQEGLLFVLGTEPEGRRVVVVWRDCDLWSNDRLEQKCRQAFESFRPDEFDLVYVNGDNHLPIIKTGEESWKVNLIEETFHARMFDTSDVE